MYIPEEGVHVPYSNKGFSKPPDVFITIDSKVEQHKLAQKIKQVRYGKETIEYITYRRYIPIDKREEGNVHHPVTPRVDAVMPKRTWDRKLRAWRRALHHWTQFSDTNSIQA